MTKKNYSKYEAKEELVTLSFNHVLLHKKDTKIYQVIFLSLLKYRFLAIPFIWRIPKNSVTLQPKGRGFVRVRASSARINVTI